MSAASPTSPRARERPSTCPRASATASSATASSRPWACPAARTRRTTCSRAARRSTWPGSASNASRSPATRRRTSPSTRVTRKWTAASSAATSSSPARSAASICPGPTGRPCSSRCAGSPSAFRRRPSSIPATGRPRPSARSSPATPSSRSSAHDRQVTPIEAPRGTHDVLPSEQPLWQKVTREMERLCSLYGYRRIQTPVFEDTDLFQRTSGQGSDIVQKEMYTFQDRAGRSLTLRPEGTAPICRAYIEHGMHREPQPLKLFTIAPMYRYSAPQRGRYREHWQLSLENVGSGDPAVDAEVIQYYDTLLRNLGVTRYELQLNSIGDRECRPAYVQRLNEWLDAHADVLDEEARQKRATSPLRVFDVKNEQVRAALQDAPKIGDSLCDACAAHFAEVRAHLDAFGVAYTIEPTLVRGLDYYTRTAFEFVGPDESTQASTICGGGRYDYLVEEIGGPPTPGIGFGAGLERLVLSLELEGVGAGEEPLDLFLVLEPGGDREELLTTMAALRRRGVACDTDYAGRSLKGQLTHAQRRATKVAIRGAGGWALRERGAQDRTGPSLEELL